MPRRERLAYADGDLSDSSWTEEERPGSAEQPVARRQVRRPVARTAQNDQLLLEQEILRDHRSRATRATRLRGHDGQVKQGEQEVLFMLGNRRYCYPLTITDFASRYLLTCEALLTTQEKFAFTVFERTFKDFGLPQVIRTDNGVPFASAHVIYGLSKLAVWWLRLGIQIERIPPAIRSKTAGTNGCI